MQKILGVGGFVLTIAGFSGLFSSEQPTKGTLQLGAITDIENQSQFLGSLNDFELYKAAITKIESGGNYRAASPVNKGGHRAWGRYQMLGPNIPKWTSEVLGRSMSINEFLDDHAAQDRVFEAKSLQTYSKYGNWGDCAAMWFSGIPLKNNNRHDMNTSVPKYAGFVISYISKHHIDGGENVELPTDLVQRDKLAPEFSEAEVNSARLQNSQVTASQSAEAMQILTDHLRGRPCHPPDLSGCGLGATYVLKDGTIGLVEPHAADPNVHDSTHKVIHPGLSLFRAP